MRSMTSEKIIESLERIFMIHGLPLSVTNDSGSQFVSNEFEKYLEDCEDHAIMAPSKRGSGKAELISLEKNAVSTS